MSLPKLSLVSKGIRARQMRLGEVLPSNLGHSNSGDAIYSLPVIDNRWVWVTDNNGIVEAALIAAPCHGVAMLWGIYATKDASSTCIVSLLRKSMDDMRDRGYPIYMVMIDPDNPSELKLKRIIAKAGGQLFGKGLIYAGYTDIGKL